MDNNNLRQTIAAMKTAMLDEKILGGYFLQLESLEDRNDPTFLDEIFSLYFSDAPKTMAEIEMTMQQNPIDVLKLTNLLHRWRGSTLSVAAERVTRAITQTIQFIKDGNFEGTTSGLGQIAMEQEYLKAKLSTYLPVWRQAKNLGVIQPDP